MTATAQKEPETVGDLVDRLPPAGNLPATTAPAAIAVVPDQPGALLAAIISASRDPAIDVAKLQALMDMQERLEDRQAKRAFTRAYARLSGKLPQVDKSGTIDLGKGKPIPFAKWEDMDAVVRPLMTAEGLSLSFSCSTREGGGYEVFGELMHDDGHSKTASMPLPLDTGPGRNNLQAAGSTLSYGKRYVAEMLLNIVRKGADDDGKSAVSGPISDDQKRVLVSMMAECEADTARFLAVLKVPTLDELPATKFQHARDLLQEKINKLNAKAA